LSAVQLAAAAVPFTAARRAWRVLATYALRSSCQKDNWRDAAFWGSKEVLAPYGAAKAAPRLHTSQDARVCAFILYIYIEEPDPNRNRSRKPPINKVEDDGSDKEKSTMKIEVSKRCFLAWEIYEGTCL
jgi:hypothetical protein